MERLQGQRQLSLPSIRHGGGGEILPECVSGEGVQRELPSQGLLVSPGLGNGPQRPLNDEQLPQPLPGPRPGLANCPGARKGGGCADSALSSPQEDVATRTLGWQGGWTRTWGPSC